MWAPFGCPRLKWKLLKWRTPRAFWTATLGVCLPRETAHRHRGWAWTNSCTPAAAESSWSPAPHPTNPPGMELWYVGCRGDQLGRGGGLPARQNNPATHPGTPRARRGGSAACSEPEHQKTKLEHTYLGMMEREVLAGGYGGFSMFNAPCCQLPFSQAASAPLSSGEDFWSYPYLSVPESIHTRSFQFWVLAP